MTAFAYEVKKPGSAQSEKGTLEAANTSEAVTQLHAKGFIVLKVSNATNSKPFSGLWQRKKVPGKEKVIFTRQLSVMIKAGLAITKALKALQRQTDHRYFKEVIGEIDKLVEGGQTLSKALKKFPHVFPEVYVAVVQAGEATGQLSEVLDNLADQQEKDAELIGKVKGAMIYPGVILGTMIGVGGLVVFFVLPNLQSIFTESGQQLPFLTRMLLLISGLIRHYLVIFVIVLAAFLYLGKLWVAQPSGRSLYDTLKIRLPIFGNLTRKLYMARFSQTMAMLVHASVPITQALKIVEKTISNVHYNAAFERIEKAVESGRSLSKAIDTEPLFPAMVSQLSSLGEETGNMEAVLLEIAKFYNQEVDGITRNLATLLEPAMLLLMGIGVGLLVAAVLTPIYGLVQNFSG